MEATELTSYFETFGPHPESTLSVAISFFLVGAMDCSSSKEHVFSLLTRNISFF